ncbi:MAG TPA: ABC transporter permease [Gaiellaceae bacterium]|nr:ABC transporter permease [Gaiellaceae bacterium]
MHGGIGAVTAGQATLAVPAGRPAVHRRVLRQSKEVVRFRHLLRYLVSTFLRTEHVGTVFGFLWWLLDPLLLMAVYTVLIDVVLSRGTPNFPLFVMAAILPWEFFTRSARNGMAYTLAKERAMRQVAFPRPVIPIAATLAEGIHLLVALALYILFAIPFGVDPSPINLLAIPIALLMLPLVLGFTFFFSTLNMFFRDTKHITDHAFRLWFYLSPSLYPATRIPQHLRGWYDLNPFAPCLESFRDVLLYHRYPNGGHLAYLAGVSFAVFLAGYSYFVAREGSFAKVD